MSFTVKSLEWRKGYSDETVTIQQASFCGLYQVRAIGGTIWLDWPDRPASQFPNIEAAKSSAQADFNARILSSIIPATKGGELSELHSAVERGYPGVKRLHEALAALPAQDTDGVAK